VDVHVSGVRIDVATLVESRLQAFEPQNAVRDTGLGLLGNCADDFAALEHRAGGQAVPELFRDAVSAIANHVGFPSKYTHFNTTKYHAKNIVSALRKWHIVLEVVPKAIDPSKGGSYLPKRYLHDIGVVNRRRSMAAPSISLLNTLTPVLRTPLGGLFENALLIQLLAGESAFHSVGTWKKDGHTDMEVDFICELPRGEGTVPIECKATLRIKRSHYKNILRYLDLTEQTYGVLVSSAPLQVISYESKKVINLPVYLATKKNILQYVLNEKGSRLQVATH
jgi:hypothetical protein